MAAAAIFGIPAANSLSSGGFEDPDSESARAGELLRDTFGRSDMQLIITVTGAADSTTTRDTALTVSRLLDTSPDIKVPASCCCVYMRVCALVYMCVWGHMWAYIGSV